MIATITTKNALYKIDLNQPIDISLVLESNENNPVAWYLNAPKIEPVMADNWVGSVAKGASTNFNNIYFNPHGHGTHTECLGHITQDFYSINASLTKPYKMCKKSSYKKINLELWQSWLKGSFRLQRTCVRISAIF